MWLTLKYTLLVGPAGPERLLFTGAAAARSVALHPAASALHDEPDAVVPPG